MSFEFMPPQELLRELGIRLRDLRIARNLEQTEVAARAGVAVRTVRSLEAGKGSTTESFLRVLKALDSLQGIDLLVPTPSISPLSLLKHPKPRQRVRKPKGSTTS